MADVKDIEPVHSSGLYKVEVYVEGQFVSGALASDRSVDALVRLLERRSNDDISAHEEMSL